MDALILLLYDKLTWFSRLFVHCFILNSFFIFEILLHLSFAIVNGKVNLKQTKTINNIKANKNQIKLNQRKILDQNNLHVETIQ